MAHIRKLNESLKRHSWERDVVNKIKYDRREDIRLYFLELLDLNWKENGINTVSGHDFKLDEHRIKYLKEDLFKVYVLRYETNRVHSMNVFIEIMDTITEALERLRDDDYIFKVIDLSLGKKSEKIFEVAIYHIDDKVDFEDIFIKK